MALSDRLARVRAYLTKEDLSAFVVKDCNDILWLTGVAGLEDGENPHLVVITQDRAVLFTDSRYSEVAGRDTDHTLWEVELSLAGREKEVASLCAEGRVAFDDRIDLATWNAYANVLVGEMVATKGILVGLRAIKDADEIAAITNAQVLTDAAFTHMLGFLHTGLTEQEIELELELFMRRAGSNGLAFASIVASGPNGSLPHAHPSDRQVQSGDFLTLDFGARYGMYRSDMTRTVAFGHATDRMREVYGLVAAANAACHEAAWAGVTGRAVHAVAADLIAAAGYGENFQHGLGHGVGIEIHERPTASPRSEDILASGNILTIEPGVYLPGEFGVRIEDMVVIEEGGCTNLTASPKDLFEL